MKRWALVLAGGVMAAIIAVPAGVGAARTRSQTPAALVPVVGTWRTAVEDGLSTLTLDGTATHGAPDAAAIAALFGRDRETFLASAGAPGAFPLAIARDVTDVRAGRLTVDFKLLAGVLDRSAGIVFNLQPSGNYNFARYNTKDGDVAVWKFEGGTRTVLAHGERKEQLPNGVWHRLTVTLNGTSVVATANDRLSVEHTLAGPISGRVGIWTKADSTTAFRRFVVVR